MFSSAHVTVFVLTLAACATSSERGDAGLDSGSTLDATEVTVWMRLPEGGAGTTLTLGGTTVALTGPETVLTVTPPIRGTGVDLHIDVDGEPLALAASWARDYEVQDLPPDTALAAITFQVLALPDGSCGIGFTNVRAENGYVWFGDGADPVSACGPFGFERFRLALDARCAGDDCAGSVEIASDGSILVDRQNEPGGPIHDARLSDEDLARVRTLLTRPELMDILAGERPCVLVGDLVETTTLEWALETAENETTLCDAYPLADVRALAAELADRYAPASP